MLTGVDPIAYLEERDPFRRALYEITAQAAREVQRRHDLERATQIAEQVGKKLFGK